MVEFALSGRGVSYKRKEGRDEGMQMGTMKLLSRLIAKRFQVSSDSVHTIFAGLTTEQLEELGERFFEAESLEEIRNWAEEKLAAKAQRTEASVG